LQASITIDSVTTQNSLFGNAEVPEMHASQSAQVYVAATW